MVFAELDRRYRESGRHYHTWEHIRECLEELDRARKQGEAGEAAAVETAAVDTAAVQTALWFHDAVYDPRAADNEERSARLARDVVRSMGLSETFGRRVEALILATRVDPTAGSEQTADRGEDGETMGERGGDGAWRGEGPSRSDIRLIRDVDLSILGKPPRRYRRYELDIRREYAWVPVEEFRRRRGALLRQLLSRRRLYGTELFRNLYEVRARGNLRWSLRRLGFPVS